FDFPVNDFVTQNDLEVSNIVYETISREELGSLDVEKIPGNSKTSVKKSISRNKNYLFLQLSPIIKDGNSFKRIKSLNITPRNNQTNFNTLNINSVPEISNSVLSTGEWFRFYVEKSGVYRLSKNFIQSLGMNLNNIDPRKIKLYGNGGRMLPLRNNESYPFDLQEIAIQVIGENDGNFDNQDYILFYAEGVDTYNNDTDTHVNIYSDRSYYYITANGFENGKRINDIIEPTQTPTLTVS